MPDDGLNETHRHDLRSWVDSANDGATDFPIQNLPYGVFRRAGSTDAWSVGVAIGGEVFDLLRAHALGFLRSSDSAHDDSRARWFEGSLTLLMEAGIARWRSLRDMVSRALRDDTVDGRRARSLAGDLLVSQRAIELALPGAIGDYSDFYASLHHATNIGAMFRPDSPLLPNYKWVPIGYHGRASSIVLSGTPVRRPCGQASADPQGPPTFGPSRRLDYEAEVGFFVGTENSLGLRVPIDVASEHLFGLCLLNDWSARDVQAWEYQPLGPFLSKSFATSLSPWVVTMEAVEPFRVPAAVRDPADPLPLPYLANALDQAHGAIDVRIDVEIRSARMREQGVPPFRLSRGTLADMYWTPAQLLTHHTSGGCNLRPGDLLGSGTVSGASRESRGCLLELTARGSEPVTLPTGEERRFLEDGDEITLRGWCERDGFARIGLGSCIGTVVPAQT